MDRISTQPGEAVSLVHPDRIMGLVQDQPMQAELLANSLMINKRRP